MARDLSSTDLNSVTTLTLDGFEAADGGTTYTIKAGDVINLVDGLDASNGSDDDLDITAAEAVTAATIGVNNSGTSATADMELDFIGAGITDVTLNSTGQKSFVDVESSAGGDLESLTINATADVAISDVDQATTITAAGSTGDVTLDTAVNKVSVTGGDGDDTVTLDHGAGVAFEGSVELGAGDDSLVISLLNEASDLVDDKVTLDGGEGTDSLTTISDLAISLSALSEENLAKKGLSSFEKIVISDATANNDAIDFDRLGISDIDFAANLVDSNSFTVSDGSTIELSAAADAEADTATVTVKDAAAGTSDDDQYSLKLNAANGAGGNNNIDYGVHNVAAVETINIESTATDAEDVTSGDNEVDLVAANAETINVTGDVALDLGVAFDGVVKTFDASDFTGASLKASFAGGALGVTATTSETDATLTGSGKADVITTGSGDDTITGGDGLDTITTGAGSDTVSLVGITAAGNRTVVKDLSADDDTIEIGVAQTGIDTAHTVAPVVAGIGAKSTTHGLADADIIEFSFDVGDTADLSNATNGSELLKGVSDTEGTAATVSVDTENEAIFLLAYDDGDAYLYHANDAGDVDTGALQAGEIALVGVFEGVEAGSLGASNFDLIDNA